MVCEVSKRSGAPCAQSGLLLSCAIINTFVSSPLRFAQMGLADATRIATRRRLALPIHPTRWVHLASYKQTFALTAGQMRMRKRGPGLNCLPH